MPRNLQTNHTDTIKFLHITDTHIVDLAEETFHGLNTKESLEAVLEHSLDHYPDIDFLLFTGDISQTGSEQSYALFKSVIENYELPIFCVPGNHDNPELLQLTVPNTPGDSINIIQLGQFSLILLNSWVEDSHHGMVTEDCLQQLDDHLKNNHGQVNIIAIHHPPVSVNSAWLDEIGLHNKTDFLSVINRYPHCSLLVFGHIHQEIDQQFDKLRILSTPSTCHQYKANSDYMCRTDTPSPAYRYVKLSIPNNIDTEVHYVE